MSDGNQETGEFVTVERYRDLSEAIVARGMLESAGIEVFLQNENTVRMDWVISNGIGGIRLQVDAANAAGALDLLEQPIPRSIALEGVEDFEQPHCPKCGSIDITNQAANFEPALVAAVGFLLPLPVGRKIWICNNCRARWEDTDD